MSYSKKTKKSMEFLEEAKTMDQCTHEVRLQYWKNIISQCQARPEGQSAKQWLADNGASVNRLIIYGNARSAGLHMN